MDATVINIGDSKGLIIPAEILKQLKLHARSVVSIFVHGNSMVIKPAPRQGWEKAAKQCHERGDDKLLIPDIFDGEEVLPW